MIALLAETKRLGSPIWGVIIPAVIFLISFVLTYWLYRRFARTLDKHKDQPPEDTRRGEGGKDGSEAS